jgi:hypothetical protein
MKAEESQQTMSRELHSKKVDRGPCSQQTMSREFQPKNRQVRVVYRCWNFAGKPPFLATFGDARRAYQAANRARQVVAAT